MSKTFILASNNQNKLKELREKLKEFGIDVISQKEAGFDIDIDETGTTFKENAILKAEAIYKLCGKPIIADDSGLQIDALDGAPGIYSNRFAGPNATDEDKYNKVLKLMKDVKDEDRTARFNCTICYIDENGNKNIFEGICEGTIDYKPSGTNGFGYDPIFRYGNKTFAELSSEEKNSISHRGKAIQKFIDYIKENN